MKRSLASLWVLRRSLLLAYLLFPAMALAGETETTAEQLLQKVADRAKEQKSNPPKREFIRTKTTLELDKELNVKEREELTYRMVIVNGALYPRLIRKNGRTLTAPEQAAEEEKESAFRNEPGEDPKSDGGNTILLRLNEETAKRFDYAITGKEQVNGRMAHVVTVTPKRGLPTKGIEEQVMAQMSGRLWIDEAESEISKLEFRLMESVHFGLLGVLGALHEFDFSVYRNRQPEGDWENSLVKVRLQFRVLLGTKRFRYEEKISRELATE